MLRKVVANARVLLCAFNLNKESSADENGNANEIEVRNQSIII